MGAEWERTVKMLLTGRCWMGRQVGGEMTKKVCGRLKVYVVGKHSEVRKECDSQRLGK